MSHTVKINTQFKRLDPLKAAFKALGWEIKEKSKLRTYPGDPQANKTFDWVAVNPSKESNAYDIGIMQNGEELGVFCDFFGGSISKQLGSELKGLKKEYAMQVIEEMYALNGATIFREQNADGTFNLDVQFPTQS